MASNRVEMTKAGPRISAIGHFGALEAVRVDVLSRTATFRVRTADGPVGPETVAPLSTVRPLSEEDSTQFWQLLVDDLVRILREKGEVPDFVKGYHVTTGEDSTGDPTLYVDVLLEPSRRLASDATVARWNSFTSLLGEALHQLRLQRWPHVQVRELRRGR
jgi:hypothetical protein